MGWGEGGEGEVVLLDNKNHRHAEKTLSCKLPQVLVGAGGIRGRKRWLWDN